MPMILAGIAIAATTIAKFGSSSMIRIRILKI
jgi:hypothetical protein